MPTCFRATQRHLPHHKSECWPQSVMVRQSSIQSPQLTDYTLGNQQTVTRNKKRLQELDIIEMAAERYVFVDSVYELWFRQQYYRRVR